MSSRHRSEIPKPAPSDRRVQHHRDRQATRHALALSDPEDVVDPRVQHTLRAEHPGQEPAATMPHRFRHWKARFWKRRTTMRRQRNRVLEEPELLEVPTEALVATPREQSSTA